MAEYEEEGEEWWEGEEDWDEEEGEEEEGEEDDDLGPPPLKGQAVFNLTLPAALLSVEFWVFFATLAAWAYTCPIFSSTSALIGTKSPQTSKCLVC